MARALALHARGHRFDSDILHKGQFLEIQLTVFRKLTTENLELKTFKKVHKRKTKKFKIGSRQSITNEWLFLLIERSDNVNSTINLEFVIDGNDFR